MILHDFPQGSPEWFRIRAGKPTASEFSRIVTNTIDKATGTYKLSSSLSGYAMELAAELFAGKPLSSFDGATTWMQRGIVMEEEACDWFTFTHGVELRKIGFITNDAGTCGGSPDRLIITPGEETLDARFITSGLEVKCCKAETHVEILSYYEKNGCAPVKYTQQVQAELWITGLPEWTQLFYHPDLPALVVPQAPDLAMHAAFDAGLKQLITERDEHLKTLRKRSQHV